MSTRASNPFPHGRQPIQPLTRHLDSNTPKPAGSSEREMVPPMVKPGHNWKNFWRLARLLSLLVIGGVFAIAINDVIPTGSTTPIPPQISDKVVIPQVTPVPSPVATAIATQAVAATAAPIVKNPAFFHTVVCLDPGHGGNDPGYEGDGLDKSEADYTLAYALALRDRLEAHGFIVVMTRDSDEAVNRMDIDINGDGLTYKSPGTEEQKQKNRNLDEFEARIKRCNAAKADLLISLHINGYPDESVQGYETWYSSSREFANQSKEFASLVYDKMAGHFEAVGFDGKGRGVNDDKFAKVDNPNHTLAHYAMLGPKQTGIPEPSKMPAAIVETLFISNSSDAAFLSSPTGEAAIVAAYEDAIVKYFTDRSDK